MAGCICIDLQLIFKNLLLASVYTFTHKHFYSYTPTPFLPPPTLPGASTADTQSHILIIVGMSRLCLVLIFTVVATQRHILRYRQPSTTACPACWPKTTNELKQCMARKTIFCTGADQVSQGRTKISCPHATTSPTGQPRKDPFHLVLFESRFQQSAGATPFQSLSVAVLLELFIFTDKHISEKA